MSYLRISAIAFASAVAICAGQSAALATQGEHEASLGLSAGVGSDCSGALIGPEARVLLHATDFWAFGVGARDRRCSARWQSGSTATTAEARWTLDALTWIPSLAGGIGVAYTASGFAPQLRAEASLDWRGQPTWGISARLSHERDGWSSSGRWLVTVAWVGYGGRGTGLDL